MKVLAALQTRIVLFVQIAALTAYAVPQAITLQTRILNPDGTPLQASSVTYQITTVDPLGTCVLYSETFSNVNMAGSNGISISSLGEGTKTYSATLGGYADVYDNSASSLNCKAGGTYTPAADDRRKIVIQFYDGTAAGWQTLPAIAINSVPYAHYAANSTKLAGHIVSDFTLKTDFPDCNTSGKVLTYNGSAFTCVAAGGGGVTLPTPVSGNQIIGYNAAGSALENKSITAGTGVTVTHSAGGIQIAATGSGGTVTSVSSANSYLSITSATTTPVFTLNVGTAANTVAAGNDSRITGAVQQTAYSADVANVLDTNCGTGSTPKWNVATDMWTCVAIGSLPASAITTGTIDNARLPASATFWQDAGSGKINYSGGNVGIGNATPAVALDVQGQIRSRTADVTSLTTIDWNSGNTLYTSDSCQAYTLTNLADGGSYTLIVKGATSAQCTFTATGITFHYTPMNAPTNAGTHALFTFLRGGSDVYVSWTTGL